MKNLNFYKASIRTYRYGFKTKIKKEIFPKGLHPDIIVLIAKKQKEPKLFKNFRINAYKNWKNLKFPLWANLILKKIQFNSISYYSIFKKKLNKKKISLKFIKIFAKLNISLMEENRSENESLARDLIFDNISVKTTYKDKLAKKGIIFCSISESIYKFPYLVQKYLGSVINSNDNYFASLNSASFTDGSFCYLPQNITCPLELSTYFRLNDKNIGQFERTLIIGEKNSILNYLEGCTAPQYLENQLHAAIVEIITLENAQIKYSTIQNWYAGNKKGAGGIYNLVTKRCLCLGKNSKIIWTQVETGSSITWKYPSCILFGTKSKGEFYSIALTKNYQQADTGTKMIHIGEKTLSKIISKGISCDFSKNTYRGLVKICLNANLSRNFSQCDSFILGTSSLALTYPYINIYNCNSIIEHEAQISKMTEDQLFYLKQRGIHFELAISLLINIFCKEVLNTLPMEFSVEIDKLIIIK